MGRGKGREIGKGRRMGACVGLCFVNALRDHFFQAVFLVLKIHINIAQNHHKNIGLVVFRYFLILPGNQRRFC